MVLEEKNVCIEMEYSLDLDNSHLDVSVIVPLSYSFHLTDSIE